MTDIFDRKKLIYFIGPTRTATTELWDQLSKSALNVSTTKGKEIYFFQSQNFGKGLNWYQSQFRDLQEKDILIDFCPTVFHEIEEFRNFITFIESGRFDVEIVFTQRRVCQLVKSGYHYNLNNGKIRPGFKSYMEVSGKKYFSYENKPYLRQLEKFKMHILYFEKIKNGDKIYLKNFFNSLQINIDEKLFQMEGKVNSSSMYLKPRSYILLSLVKATQGRLVPHLRHIIGWKNFDRLKRLFFRSDLTQERSISLSEFDDWIANEEKLLNELVKSWERKL